MSPRPALAALLLFAVAGAAYAMPPFGKSRSGDQGRPAGDLLPGGALSAPRADPPGLDANAAARQAQSMNGGGRVLSVEEARSGWRVKLLKDGNVRIVFVPD